MELLLVAWRLAPRNPGRGFATRKLIAPMSFLLLVSLLRWLWRVVHPPLTWVVIMKHQRVITPWLLPRKPVNRVQPPSLSLGWKHCAFRDPASRKDLDGAMARTISWSYFSTRYGVDVCGYCEEMMVGLGPAHRSLFQLRGVHESASWFCCAWQWCWSQAALVMSVKLSSPSWVCSVHALNVEVPLLCYDFGCRHMRVSCCSLKAEAVGMRGALT